ncbi:alpha/beta hydrolase [Streptoalloteichus tenebrarius]|uniref:alpha/beta hydrolase n=1 Tax=Streptoalloteichus tenebrarius (strain ATCC 17920 / DSM 40477 / JCM 4838 / CBS 697.72 / NBRC 16177 / NCIMB 11028 / NRRL B-12390 / A12253. 1 / ISP 5477) TaxID=1933 RepID=UPI0020A467C6|nr:alpha/beta hydrolase [Streptoalloteichus tenebrarius]
MSPRSQRFLVTVLAFGLLPALPAAADPPVPAPRITFGPCLSPSPAPAVPDGPDGATLECGQLDVPLDHSHPDGRTLRLAVSRVRASGSPEERRGVLLVNPGGPGGSGLDYAATKRAKMPESVRRAFDVVGFDPRGVGSSSPVSCGQMGGRFDHPGQDPVPTDDEAERSYMDNLRRTARDCATEIGDALPHIGTANTARDMDLLRAALGERRISFLGVSYGSYLGAAYATLFPHRVDRMVLDSVVGPDDWYDFDRDQAVALIRQRDTLFDWFAQHPTTFRLGSTRDEVRQHYVRTREELARRGEAFGPAEFDRLVYRALGRTERWEKLGLALRAFAETGSSEQLRTQQPAEDAATRNFEAANRTVKCADGPGPRSEREIVADLRRLRSLDPRPVLTGMEATVCHYWAYQPRKRVDLGRRPGIPPILLTQAEFDPVTPYAGAQRMRRALSGSRMVTLSGGHSHGVFASQRNTCVDETTAAYLVHGALPSVDLRCTGTGAGLPTPSA